MKSHDRLTLIPNRLRVRDLRAFRDLVERYYERSERDADDLLVDWEGAQAARAEVNRMLPRIVQVVAAAGLGTAAVAGTARARIGDPEALHHIFTSRFADSAGQEVLDLLDMTIGVYDAGRFGALARTVNPLHYAGIAVGFVAGLPRRLFVALGLVGRSAGPPVRAEDVKRLEAAAARLADTEELIEARFAELRERQAQHLAASARQLTELAERLDFAERMLAQKRLAGEGKPQDVSTPV